MKLANRYFIAFAAITTAVFVTYGTVHAVTEYHRSIEHAGDLQRAEARVIATRIGAYLELVAAPTDAAAAARNTELNLQLLRDIVAAVDLPKGGRAYISGRAETSLAQVEPGAGRAERAASRLALFADVRAITMRSDSDAFTSVTTRPGDDAELLTSVAAIAGSDWSVFVEQPLAEVMAPVRASLYRTLALLSALLAAGILASHDLRQPMQAISLMIEVLRERLAQQEVCGLVEKVQASVHALETLFVSLLDISRLDAGAVQAHRQEFAIDGLLQLLHANFAAQAAAKGLELHVLHSHAIVRSDPALLERILANLVSNAIRYTLHGRVIVGCRRRGERLQVLVIDTGIGVPSALHDTIFDEFFRIAAPEQDRNDGLGLGLSIVKRTAELLQHPLIMRSEPRRGSTFGVELPLVTGGAQSAVHAHAATPHDTRLAGTFVLVIDDDAENRFAIETLCAQWGCHVLGASSAEAALSGLHDHLRGPDLIIADYRLRGRDTGMSAIELLRRDQDESIPAILMTGDTSLQAWQLAPRAQLALLHKPINADKLWDAAVRLVPAH